MPIWLRKFTFGKMQEFFDKENEKQEQQQQQLQKKAPKTIEPPISPTYKTKASPK